MNKTQANDGSVEEFVAGQPESVQRDCKALLEMMGEVTGETPKMWGQSIVGFGDLAYKYASGREGRWFVVGFSPRKQNLTIYIVQGGFEGHADRLARLGKHKIGGSCLYVKSLADVDFAVLREIVVAAVK